MLIDTHLHLIDRTRLTYPWLSEVPALNRDWLYSDYEHVAKRLGISKTLHMEVDVAETDITSESDWVREIMTQDNCLLCGAISSARPEAEDFEAFLDQLDMAIVKGVRRVLHVVADGISQSDTFRANVRLLGKKSLPFDICMLERQLQIAMDLVDACPDTVFVVDHCGVPDIAGGTHQSWAASITELAKRPNTNAKISGITAYAKADWTLDTLRPYTEHVIESFGWDRVVWGSDSPVCTLNSNLEQWVAVTHALVAGASSDEREKFFAKNAMRIWRL